MSKTKPKQNCRWISEKDCFEYRFYYDGKRYSCYGKTEREAREKANEKERLLSERMNLDNRKITLNAFHATVWLEEQKKIVKTSTLYAYEKQWKYISDELGDMKLIEITKADIMLFQKKQIKSRSAASVNRSIRLLKQILSAAVDDRIISFNPCTVKPLKTERTKATDTIHRALSDEEVEIFMKYASNSHYYNLFQFLKNSGLRIGEALALQLYDITRGEVRITKTVSRTSGSGYELSDTPKTASSYRTIPISDKMEPWIEAQKRRNTLLFGVQPWLFPNSRGEMANYNSVDICIHSIVRMINNDGIEFEPFSVHAFRDTYATNFIKNGGSPYVLMKLLGHSNIKITLGTYVQPSLETMKTEMEKTKVV